MLSILSVFHRVHCDSLDDDVLEKKKSEDCFELGIGVLGEIVVAATEIGFDWVVVLIVASEAIVYCYRRRDAILWY